jgi:hypothetical protein
MTRREKESAKQTTAIREQEPGEEITKAEVERQMARLEKNKAPGVGKIQNKV